MNLKNVNPLIAVAAAVALVAALLIVFLPGGEQRTVTAEFPRTVSLYEGSDVKILGVAVGTVDSVQPSGTKVIVKFHYDAQYKVPADAKAAVISPSIVGDRFIQLTPVYRSGEVLKDGARLGVERTATPLELDEIFGSINDLNIALGPDGANKPDETGVGPLSRLLDSTARNFGGQGVQFNKTLKNLGKLTQTLSNNKDELFGTVAEVEKFTKTFADNDDVIRRFNDSLAGGAQLLEEERDELAAVLVNLSEAMRQVRSFVADNKQLLGSNIRGLNRITAILAKNRKHVDEILKVAPVALNNLVLAGDPRHGTLDTRADVPQNIHELTTDPVTSLCILLGDQCSGLDPLLDLLGSARTAPFDRSSGPTAQDLRIVENVDRTLGGLLEVQR